MKNRLPEILAALSILVAILLVFHQRITNGFWFHPRGSWHHESVEGCFVALAIGLLVGHYLGKRWG